MTGRRERERTATADSVCPSTNHSSRTAGMAIQQGLMKGTAPAIAAKTEEEEG